MKTKLVTAVCVMSVFSLFAQGTIDFKDDSTALVKGMPPGETCVVGLWWAPVGTTDPVAFTFLPSSRTVVMGNGLFQGGIQTINEVAGGAAVALQVRGWDAASASWDMARIRGESAILTYTTGNPNGFPIPGDPGSLMDAGFKGLTLSVVPEPSTIALGLIGLAGLLVSRRRRQ